MTSQTDAFPDLHRVQEFFPLGVAEPKTLTHKQIDQFNDKGYILPLNVFRPDEVATQRNYFDNLLANAMNAGWNSYSINSWQVHCAGIYDVATDNRILDYVQDLLGENLVLWGTHYFTKLPGDKKRVSWHQDASYWPLTPSKTVTVWLAIDDADAENGAMQFIPGSHLKAQLPFEKSSPEENNVLSQTVRDATRYGDHPVLVELRAGQVSIHSDWLLHGSEANMSDRRRCGLTMRFVSADVRAFKGRNRNSIICRGKDPSGHWANNSRPDGDHIPPKRT